MNIFETRLRIVTLLLLAWRNLWRHRRRTIITLMSIALGFALAVLSIGIQDAGHNSMVRNGIKFGEGHLTLQPQGYLESPDNFRFIARGKELLNQLRELEVPGDVAPRVSLRVLASTAVNSVGAGLEGIDVTTDPRVTLLQEKLIDGAWLKPGDKRGLLIGAGMARKLKARVGSKIVIMSGKRGGETEALLGKVRGIFNSGLLELDNFLIMSGLDFCRHFLIAEGGKADKEPVTRIAIFLNEMDMVYEWKQILQKNIKDDQVSVLDWQEMMPQLVQYIIVDDVGAYIMLILILVVIVFGIVNTVLMSVLERTREFGLLRALGLNRGLLLELVFIESVLLSVLAVFFGWCIGGAVHLYFATQGMDLSGVIPEGTGIAGSFMDTVIYTELSMERIAQLTIIVFSVTLASGIYPAIKAARVTPVEALRT